MGWQALIGDKFKKIPAQDIYKITQLELEGYATHTQIIAQV